MPLSSKERAELRAEAHHLSADVHVGHQGITPTLVQALDDALRTREPAGSARKSVRTSCK
jgi:RNA-binding protein